MPAVSELANKSCRSPQERRRARARASRRGIVTMRNLLWLAVAASSRGLPVPAATREAVGGAAESARGAGGVTDTIPRRRRRKAPRNPSRRQNLRLSRTSRLTKTRSSPSSSRGSRDDTLARHFLFTYTYHAPRPWTRPLPLPIPIKSPPATPRARERALPINLTLIEHTMS